MYTDISKKKRSKKTKEPPWVRAILKKERHTVWINHAGVYYHHDMSTHDHTDDLTIII